MQLHNIVVCAFAICGANVHTCLADVVAHGHSVAAGKKVDSINVHAYTGTMDLADLDIENPYDAEILNHFKKKQEEYIIKRS